MRHLDLIDAIKIPPPTETVIIVENQYGVKDQVEIVNGIAFKWRYKSTTEVFCKANEIKAWRGCTGFDF